MTSNTKVRTKLLVVIVPLVLGVIAAAGMVVFDRVALADEYSEDAALIELTSAQAAFASSVATESVWAVIGSGGDEFAIGEFEATAEAANDAWDQFALVAWPKVDGLDQTLDDRVSALEDEFIRRIYELREEVLAGTAHPDVVKAGYESLDVALIGVEDAVMNIANQVETFSSLNTSQQLSAVSLSITEIGRAAAASAAEDPIEQAQPELREQLGAYRLSKAQLLLGADTALHGRYEDSIAALDDAGATTALDEGTISDVLDSGVGDGERLLPLSETLAALNQDLLDEARSELDGLHDDTIAALRNFLLVASLGLLAAIGASVLLARSISKPLSRLNARAATLASKDLPKLLDQLHKSGSAEPWEDHALPVDSNDEIGELAGSINSISKLAMGMAAERSELLRTNLRGVFVHLAQRNKGLLDRQIGIIDELEEREDADQLESLFELDHLATRLRRNAESLLVIAGVETPRRHGTSIGLVDVLRVAAGEVEDHERIELISIDPVNIGGEVAVDLAHLLSELLENATQFSAADTKVEIRAGRGDGNGFKITIADRGIGMVPDQASAANELLANPSLTGGELSRSLGLTVVAHLAARIDTKVTILSSAGTGTVATVLVPMTAIMAAESEDLGPGTAGPAQDTVSHQVHRAPITPDFEREEGVVPTVAAALADLEPIIASTDPTPHSIQPRTDPESVPRSSIEPETGEQETSPASSTPRSVPGLEVPDKPVSTPRAAPTRFSASGSTGQDPAAPATRGSTNGDRSADAPDDRSMIRAELVNDPSTQPAPGFKELAEFAQAQGAAFPEAGPVQPKPASEGAAQATGGATTLTSNERGRSATPTKRSSEEVRRLLSRYRGGSNKGQAGQSSDIETDKGGQD